MFKRRSAPKINYRPYIPALVSGAALVFCFPTFDFYPLAWIALVPFLVSLWGMPPSRAFRAGFFMGIPYFLGTHYWVYHSIYHYGGASFVSSMLVAVLLSLYLSLYTGAFGSLFAFKISCTSLPALFMAPLFWVLLEYLRTYALTGFPGAIIGYSQYKFLYAIQISDITGVYGVSFLVVSVNGALADFFIARKRLKRMPLFHMSPTLVGHFLLAASCVAVFAYGSFRLGETVNGKDLRASIVQASIRQDRKWDRAFQSSTMDAYKLNTIHATMQKPSLIVWPETAVPFYFGYDAEMTGELIEFQKNVIKTPLLFGAITTRPKGLANSALLLRPDGTLGYVYDKIHLVPFGEYIPLKRLFFFLDKLVVGIGDYVAGDQYLRAETEFGSFGTLICYEMVFPGLVRRFYKDGGDFMVNITNDAWFGRTPGPYMHFSFGVFRAVENRKPLIRAANTGISGFIDSRGRVMEKSALFEGTVLTKTIKTDPRRSFYTRFGDLFIYACLIIGMILLFDPGRK